MEDETPGPVLGSRLVRYSARILNELPIALDLDGIRGRSLLGTPEERS
jgi:hypothetical protein